VTLNDVADPSDDEADADGEMTVLDRFLAAGISREKFDSHLAAGRIAVAGQRISDPATPAPAPISVQIMLDLTREQPHRSTPQIQGRDRGGPRGGATGAGEGEDEGDQSGGATISPTHNPGVART
jgi:hypothetical protein